MSSYRHKPFAPAKKRKKKTTLNSPAKRRINGNRNGNKNLSTSVPFRSVSASHNKILTDLESSSESDNSSDEEYDEPLTSCYWIMNIDFLQECLKKACTCKYCHNEVRITENCSFRAGLATKFELTCANSECLLKEDCFTTKKTRHSFDINRQSILATRLAGKGRKGILKICSVLGLSSPLAKSRFSEHVKFWEKTSYDLREENLFMCAKRAKELMARENGVNVDTVLDVPTSFDGSWSSRGWTANNGIVSAIADISSQVIDISYKCRSCAQCTLMNERKHNGEVTAVGYLDWFIEHEINCFKNHDGSPQVLYFIYIVNLVPSAPRIFTFFKVKSMGKRLH